MAKEELIEMEGVVQEVLRRLRVAGVEQSEPPAGGVFSIDERVVTLESVRGKLDGVSELIVLKDAVVTPAVRDELSDRKIALKRNL